MRYTHTLSAELGSGTVQLGTFKTLHGAMSRAREWASSPRSPRRWRYLCILSEPSSGLLCRERILSRGSDRWVQSPDSTVCTMYHRGVEVLVSVDEPGQCYHFAYRDPRDPSRISHGSCDTWDPDYDSCVRCWIDHVLDEFRLGPYEPPSGDMSVPPAGYPMAIRYLDRGHTSAEILLRGEVVATFCGDAPSDADMPHLAAVANQAVHDAVESGTWKPWPCEIGGTDGDGRGETLSDEAALPELTALSALAPSDLAPSTGKQ